MTVNMEYYTAVWCGPCKMMGPIIEQLKTKGWDITKIDVDLEPAKAQLRGVMAMPTFLLFKDGNMAKRITGARPLNVLEAELRALEG